MREIILILGKAKSAQIGMTAWLREQDTIAEFTVVNDRSSTFSTQYGSKMALMHGSQLLFMRGYWAQTLA